MKNTVKRNLSSDTNEMVPRAALVRCRQMIMNLVEGKQFTCPLCESVFGRFLPFSADNDALKKYAVIGAGFRKNAHCPRCFSKDRDRLVYLYLRGPGASIEGWRRILHLAPEPCLREFLIRAASVLYISGDIAPIPTTTRFDLTAAPFPDSSFDLIVCNHVLPAIVDDGLAMIEIRRLLTPLGTAILQVPISRKIHRTFEDATLTTPVQRLAAFGNEDQVRIYGRDYLERLRRAGLVAHQVKPGDWLSSKEMRRFALIRKEVVFVCRLL